MRLSGVLLALLLLSGGSLVAGEPTPDKVVGEAVQEVQAQTAKEAAAHQAAVTRHERFSHAIDLWHDSHLKGDKEQIRRHTTQLFLLMDNDIEASRLALAGTAVKVSKSSYGPQQDRETTYRGVYSRPRTEFEKKQSEILAKRRLAESARRSEAFSNRFRLFNDYLELMKRATEPTKVQMAEGGDEDPIK
jgi:hypothetical protein